MSLTQTEAKTTWSTFILLTSLKSKIGSTHFCIRRYVTVCAVPDRWFGCCCQTGRQTLRLETTVGDGQPSTYLHHWSLTCSSREWSRHREPSRTARTLTLPVVQGVAGGFPRSSRAILTHCGYSTHQPRQQRRHLGLGRLRAAYRGSLLWAGWTPDCTEVATEPRSSTAPPSGTQERWEEERSSQEALSEPGRCPTCLDEFIPLWASSTKM